MNRQNGVCLGRTPVGRGSWWLIAVVGAALAASPALAQRGRVNPGNNNSVGPSTRQGPAPQQSAPRAQAPAQSQPAARSSPRSSAPAPAVRQAPSVRSAPVTPSRPPVVVQPPRSAPNPGGNQPPRFPVFSQPPKSASPVLTQPPKSASPVMTGAPTRNPVITQAPSRPRPSAPPTAAPKAPPSSPPVLLNPPKSAPPVPEVSRPTPPTRNPANRPPVQSAPPSKPPVNPGGAASPPPTGSHPGTMRPTQKPTPSSGSAGGRPAGPPTKAPEGFDQPLRPKTPSVWSGSRQINAYERPRGGLTPAVSASGHTPIANSAVPSDLRPVGGRHGSNGESFSNTSVVVGIGVGTGYRGWECAPAPRFNGCFTPCHTGWSGPSCFNPCYNPCWNRDRWGCWYVSNWGYCSDWWWYPTYYHRTYPCGSFSYFGFAYRNCDWGFSFAYSPAWSYTSCGLISPSVYTVYEAAPVYTVYGEPSVAVITQSESQPAPTVVASASPLPAPATSDQLRISTDRELADVYLRLGDSANAIRVYTDHISRFPGDVDAVRSLGVAMIEADRAAEGADQIERAYLMDQTLVQRPLPRDLLADPDRLARVLDSATRHAAQDNSGRSWLAVAVLMQADGRAGPARSALERARAAGLYSRIVDGMQAALPIGQQ